MFLFQTKETFVLQLCPVSIKKNHGLADKFFVHLASFSSQMEKRMIVVLD